MMSESESLEEESKSTHAENTLAKTLELLDDRQTMQLVRVIAEDNRMKCDLYSMVRETKRNFTEIDRRFPARRDRCTFCHQMFGRSRKSQKCKSCERFMCKNCIQIDKCPCCLALERSIYKEEEFKVLCPFAESLFGLAKFKALSVERLREEDWLHYAILEFHFQYEFKQPLDNVPVNFYINDTTLESARQQLVLALMSFNQDGHFATIKTATMEIKSILQNQSSWIQEDDTQIEKASYFQLLSSAVVWVLNTQRTEPVRSRADLDSISSHRSYFPQLTDEDRKNSEAINELYSLEVDNQELIQNWFAKPRFNSPRGSMRSQSASHIINSITTPQFFRYFSENHLHYMTNNIKSEVETGNESFEAKNEASDVKNEAQNIALTQLSDQTSMNIKMDRREINAINGQFVQISCYLITNDPTVEILWFNQHRQICDSPRTPIRNFTNESILEIFDCSVNVDSGEIICLAIGQTGIVSDVCQLTIADEDLPAEEPFFVETLSVSNAKPSEGSAFYLQCHCIGYPLPYVSFFHDNKLIEHGEKSKISHNDGNWSLRITNASSKNSGKYTAVASNRCGKVSNHLEVEVQTSEVNSSTQKEEKVVSVTLKAVNLTMTEETVQLEAKRPRIVNGQKKKLSFGDLSVNDVKI